MFTDTQDRGFTKDVCRSMVAMLDVDHSGKLGFEEFRTLWNDIRKWRVNLLFSFKTKIYPSFVMLSETLLLLYLFRLFSNYMIKMSLDI